MKRTKKLCIYIYIFKNLKKSCSRVIKNKKVDVFIIFFIAYTYTYIYIYI